MENFSQAMQIYIGVTGHREVPSEQIPALRARVEQLLASLQRQYPHCSLTVLSPLAEGMDRICAEVALMLGLRLIVPLPMAAQDYRQDFDAASKQDFDALCTRADRVFVVPEQEEKAADAPRGYYYRQAGRFVAEHCHVMLALWDGRETLFPEGGGTYETIVFAKEKDTPVHVIPLPLPTTAQNCPETEDALVILDQFRADMARKKDWLMQQAQQRGPDMLDAQTQKTLSVGACSVLRTFLQADALSLYHRNLKLRALRALSVCGLLLVLAFLLYDEMEADLMLFVYAAIILLALLVFRLSARRQVHQKYIVYRAMAETLRVQFYWALCGIKDLACDSFAFTQKSALSFCRAVTLSLWEDLETAGPLLPEKAKEYWIIRQIAYHEASDRKKSARDGFHKRAEKAMLILSFALFILVFGLELFAKQALERELPLGPLRVALYVHEGAVLWRSVLKILLGAVSAATAFLSSYYGSLALPRQIFDNRRMKSLFETAKASDPGQKEQFISAMRLLGREAMIECGGWHVAQLENAPSLSIG